MCASPLFILKREAARSERPYLLKLNRETSELEVFKKCGNEKLYDSRLIRQTYDSNAYVVFEKEVSFPCIYGGGSTPTPTGVFQIEAKSSEEYISPYYPNHSQVKFFGYLVIFEDYFIHSDLYAAEAAAPAAGRAISLHDKTTSGCIRVSQKALSWLIEHIDVGTIALL